MPAFTSPENNLKSLRALYILLPYIAFVLCGLCGCSRDIDRRLSEADNILYTSPDSALAILKDIEIDDDDERHMAFHALLTAKASVKSHKPVNADIPLDRAVRFYENQGDSLEIQSLYYYGRSLLERDLFSEALSVFTLSYDMASMNDNHFYAGLAAREITKLYDRFLTSKDQLQWAEEEKLRFVKAGKTLHSLWADLDILRAYNRNNMPDSTLELAARIDSRLMTVNRDFRVLVNSEKALALWSLRHFEESSRILRHQTTEDAPLNAGQWCILSDSYAHTGDVRAAFEACDSAASYAFSRMDSIRVARMEATLYSMTGDYRKAAETYGEFTERLLEEVDARCAQTELTSLSQSMRDKLMVEMKLNKALSQRNTVLLAVAALISIALFFAALWLITRHRLYRKNIEINSVRVDTANGEVKEMDCGISGLLSPYLGLLDHTYGNIYSSVGRIRRKNAEKQFDEVLLQLRSKETFDNMEEVINTNNDNWMKLLDSTYPGLSSSCRVLAMLLFLGFSTSSIALLTGRDSTAAVHTAKSRLKKQLSDCRSPEALAILKRLGLD